MIYLFDRCLGRLPIPTSLYLKEELVEIRPEDEHKSLETHALETVKRIKESKRISIFALSSIGVCVTPKQLSPFMMTCFFNKPSYLKFFLSYCSRGDRDLLISARSREGFNAVHYAVGGQGSEDSTDCLEILIEHGANIEIESPLGTLLMQAIKVGKLKIFDFLLSKSLSSLKVEKYREHLFDLIESYDRKEMQLHLMAALESLEF